MDANGKSLAIVGGGASGLAAAIAAGEWARTKQRSLSISIYERDDRVGRTILATGNGRCNFSNANLQCSLYRNSSFVSRVLQALETQTNSADPVHDFFQSLGLVWRQESDGREYPLANKASAVLDVLRAGANVYDVREECDSDVASIVPPRDVDKPFTLRMVNGVLKRADAIIVASGGRTLSTLDAHEIPRTVCEPVLGPLAVVERDAVLTRELDNIRVRVVVSLLDSREGEPVATETGELLFRKYGVSGICIFNLSRFAKPGQFLALNFLEGRNAAEAEEFLSQRFIELSNRFGRLTYSDLLRGILLPRVSDAVVKSTFTNPHNHISQKDIASLAKLLTAFPLEVAGITEPQLCQVRRGGFQVEAFDPTTMGALETPGLYACGEAVDVDGPCGGYNLHWAWASGIAAGRSAAARLVG